MDPYEANKPIYQRPILIGHHANKPPEQIYSDPLLVVAKKPSEFSEKQAVQYIVERYDSLKRLDAQLEGLHVSDDSIAKLPLDDDAEVDVGELSEEDVNQIEVFFRSHKTHISVCRCLANLYFCNDQGQDQDWGEPARTGVPVLLLDKGETKARNKRVLQIVLAEKGSGFVLWKDIIDNLSNYRSVEGSTFHTMYLSSDHRRQAGLSFDVSQAADYFLQEVERLTSDPLNISLSVPKSGRKKAKPPKKEKFKMPKKCEISSPCCFQHVTNVALDDKKKLFSMATLVSHRASS